MTAGPCIAVTCPSTDTRPYLTGPACSDHSPWALAGRPDPSTQVDPALTSAAMRVMPTAPWEKGGTDLDKERPGGYVSRQRAQKISSERAARLAAERAVYG